MIYMIYMIYILVLGGIPVHTEYRCLFFLWYEFFKYRYTGMSFKQHSQHDTVWEGSLLTVAREQLYVLLSGKVLKLKL